MIIYIFFTSNTFTFIADQFSTAQVACVSVGGTTVTAGWGEARARDAMQLTPAARAHGACHGNGAALRHVPAITRHTFSS